MLKFEKPINLNGEELRAELRSAGINISEEPFALVLNSEGLFLDIDIKDESIAMAVIAAHNGTIVAPEPTPADKLAAAGLTVDELKAVLGLN